MHAPLSPLKCECGKVVKILQVPLRSSAGWIVKVCRRQLEKSTASAQRTSDSLQHATGRWFLRSIRF